MIIKNPINSGNFADPEARKYGDKYYIYATHSLPFEQQHNLSVFVSDNLSDWTQVENIINMDDFPRTWGAVWAPTIIDKDGKYYLVFATNCLRRNEQKDSGGIQIAVSDSPTGPFRGYLGKPLIGEYINDAQPIDAHLFKEDDGTIYLFYGGEGHCNVAVMNDKMDGFIPFDDGEIFHEITPTEYVEGPCMFKYKGKYYFMWSTGDWTNESYGVLYSVGDSPLGPFKDGEKILSSDPEVAKGPGHHGYIYLEYSDEFLIVYHRRNLDEIDGHSRHLCIDKMNIHDEKIDKVKMTFKCEI